MQTTGRQVAIKVVNRGTKAFDIQKRGAGAVGASINVHKGAHLTSGPPAFCQLSRRILAPGHSSNKIGLPGRNCCTAAMALEVAAMRILEGNRHMVRVLGLGMGRVGAGRHLPC